jgi:hypothetical protein
MEAVVEKDTIDLEKGRTSSAKIAISITIVSCV